MSETVEVLVDGGKASAGPPVGPALGPTGVNVGEVINEINDRTKDFAGMKVPVKITIDPVSKSFELAIGTPPTSELIKKELSIDKGAANAATNVAGKMPIETAVKIARMKIDSLTGQGLKQRVKEVLGTCVSMGIKVEGKDPREVQREIDQGKYDDQIKDE